MVGTGLAIGLGLLGMGTKAATDIYSAKKASSASKEAAELQTKAADQAQRQYDDVFSPYLNSGRATASTLGRLVSPGPGARYAAADPTQPPRQAMPSGPMAGGRPRPAGAPDQGMARSRTLGGMARGGAPEMVLMEADGETRPVPADQVARFEQAGARRVA